MRVAHFGLQIPYFTFEKVPDGELFERVAAIAGAAERAGFDSVWVMDHFDQIPFVGARTEPMLEAYTLLGGIAARTSRVGLGTLVTGVTYRNPALVAKTVTTLDIVSSGRAILGIGAAWFEAEHVSYGFDFPPVGERMDRLEEALQICRLMFTQEQPTFEGRHYRIREVVNHPRPVRPGGPPILVGGGGERRTLRMVAQYADMSNFFGDVPTVRHKLDVLERHCADVGRDPATIVKTRLGGIAIGATHAAAEEAFRRTAEVRQGVDNLRAVTFVGDPAGVAEQAQAYLDAGLDGLIFNMIDAHDLEQVALAGQALALLRG